MFFSKVERYPRIVLQNPIVHCSMRFVNYLYWSIYILQGDSSSIWNWSGSPWSVCTSSSTSDSERERNEREQRAASILYILRDVSDTDSIVRPVDTVFCVLIFHLIPSALGW